MNTCSKTIPVVFILLLLSLFCPVKSIATISLRQDSVKTGFVDGKFRTTFYVYAPASQNYSVKFWVMGVEKINQSGGNSTYDYGVDGVVRGTLHPSKNDWCECTPSNQTFYLTEGTHEIYLEDYYELPNAEAVYSYSGPAMAFHTNDYLYDRMKRHSNTNSQYYGMDPLVTNYRQLPYHPLEQDSLVAPIHYTAELNKEVYYTFYRLDYYLQGQYVNINTYAEDSLKRIVHVFNQDVSFSVTSPLMDTDSDYFTCSIPQDGFYYVLIRSYNPNEWGTCNITINNRGFDDVPVNSSYTAIESPEVGKEYACFAMSDIGDPVVFLMEPGYGGGITNCNDDYCSFMSNFEWGKTARIDGLLSTGQWLLTLTKSFPSSRLNKCDIYTRCEKSVYYDPVNFPNYKLDDILFSSDSTWNYNCVSWAVGDWIVGYWATSFEQTIGEAFHAYVDSVLVAYGFTADATEDGSVVDLWARQCSNGELEYTHVSVKSKIGHPYAGGYAWESKMGNLQRVFHPRYALQNEENWGHVISHYGKSLGIDPIINPVVPGPVLLNINISPDEFSQIEEGVRSIPQAEGIAFDELFDDCKAKGTLKVTIYIDSFEKCETYPQLLEYCKKCPQLVFVLYQKICEGDILAIKILKDLTFTNNQAYLWKEAVISVRQLCNEKKDVKCLYNAQTYGLYLVKLLLANEKRKADITKSVSYSNSPMIKTITHDKNIDISFELDSNAIVSVCVGNTDGSNIKNVANKLRLGKGTQTFKYHAPRAGYYVVGLIINGSIYKKILLVE